MYLFVETEYTKHAIKLPAIAFLYHADQLYTKLFNMSIFPLSFCQRKTRLNSLHILIKKDQTSYSHGGMRCGVMIRHVHLNA